MGKLESTLKEEKLRLDRIENYFNEYIKNAKIDINSITKKDVDDFITKYVMGQSRTTLYSNIKYLNVVLSKKGINIKLDSSDYVDELKFNSNKYFTRKEVQDICDVFQNHQDRFIVYALWSGIMGKDYEDLINLKISDVAEDYSYININGRKFICDDYMKETLERTINTDYYIKYVYESNICLSGSEYEFNMNSPYIIKIKPSKKNANGLNHMNKVGIQTRLRKLSDVFSEMGIYLTGKSLEKSGIIFRMFLIEAWEQKEWTVENIDEWLNMEDIKGNASDFYRIYHWKYHNSPVLD